MKSRFLMIAVISLILVGFTEAIFGQYVGNSDSQQSQRLEECIGGWGMCPEQQLAMRLENDQKNALLVLAIGIPSFSIVVFLIWRKRK